MSLYEEEKRRDELLLKFQVAGCIIVPAFVMLMTVGVSEYFNNIDNTSINKIPTVQASEVVREP